MRVSRGAKQSGSLMVRISDTKSLRDIKELRVGSEDFGVRAGGRLRRCYGVLHGLAVLRSVPAESWFSSCSVTQPVLSEAFVLVV